MPLQLACNIQITLQRATIVMDSVVAVLPASAWLSRCICACYSQPAVCHSLSHRIRTVIGSSYTSATRSHIAKKGRTSERRCLSSCDCHLARQVYARPQLLRLKLPFRPA